MKPSGFRCTAILGAQILLGTSTAASLNPKQALPHCHEIHDQSTLVKHTEEDRKQEVLECVEVELNGRVLKRRKR